jgi:hypothetical protein
MDGVVHNTAPNSIPGPGPVLFVDLQEEMTSPCSVSCFDNPLFPSERGSGGGCGVCVSMIVVSLLVGRRGNFSFRWWWWLWLFICVCEDRRDGCCEDVYLDCDCYFPFEGFLFLVCFEGGWERR